MDEAVIILQHTSLFAGIAPPDILHLLRCSCARIATYQKDEALLWEGSAVEDIGVILRGEAVSQKDGPGGKTIIVALLQPGGFVGVLLAPSRARPSPVTVMAHSKTEVLWLPFAHVLQSCIQNCPCHSALLRNCFDSIALKSMHLLERIDCLIRPTLREKILAFLHQRAKESGSASFLVPLDRAALADYINADRSALSRELGRLKQEGVIDYYQNSFKILKE